MLSTENDEIVNLLTDRNILSGKDGLTLYRFPRSELEDSEEAFLAARVKRNQYAGSIGKFFLNIFGDRSYFTKHFVSEGNQVLVEALE